MFMRLHTPASLCLAAAALLAAAPPVHAEPPAALPSCATDGGTFPLTTRLHGGPASYTAGGGYGTWYLDVTNTTARACTGIHPVVVLVDAERALEPSQPRLEFYGGRDSTRPHPVRFETTDEDELVGAFDGFPGFTVGPGKTLTVKVRLAITSDAVPNEVTANAAVVQRHDDDGDWVGQSNDYRFTIDADPADPTDAPDPTDPAEGAASAAPHASATPGTAANRLTLADELARTGLSGPTAMTLAATAALLLTGAGLLFARRRR
ncbi:hypothetical protein [Streptomyces viridochromogenes]|uniref:Gram-positive cocci surface proteins LPxTG domain-containing protein n=1 Tax=Streptomyces viridochromogenes Tue57 TaxID=1160705 RepID=L8PB14_STRVR|nr:hypothetical protein STVIR_5510 [Streptomyces viridochromogenes Tue57]